MESPLRIVRMSELSAIVGLRKSRIYELIKAGEFPKPVKLSVQASGWRSDHLADWIRSRPAA